MALALSIASWRTGARKAGCAGDFRSRKTIRTTSQRNPQKKYRAVSGADRRSLALVPRDDYKEFLQGAHRKLSCHFGKTIDAVKKIGSMPHPRLCLFRGLSRPRPCLTRPADGNALLANQHPRSISKCARPLQVSDPLPIVDGDAD